MSIANSLSETRQQSGISRKELARRSGVPTSTVSRVEEGLMDPTFTMTQRLFGALGCDVHLAIQPMSKSALANLADAFIDQPWGTEIDFVRVRSFIDYISSHPESASSAIAQPPARSGDSLMDCMLAAIAEKIADDNEITRPNWCEAVPALGKVWRSPGTPAMNKRNDQRVPPQFRARKIFLSEISLWRPKG